MDLSDSQQSLQLETQCTDIEIEDDEEIQKNDLLALICTKKIQKPKRRKRERCILQVRPINIPIFYPINNQEYFLLNGHFGIYVSHEGNNERNRTRIINVAQVYDNYLFATLPCIQYFKDFEIPIQMLERSQDRDKYIFAQQLRDIKQMINQSIESIKKIKKAYSKSKHELDKLSVERSKFRQELIKKYIKENFKEDDFYSIAEFGENFEYQQIEMISLILSKSFIAILGVEEKDINSFFLHVGMLDYIFLSNQENFYGTIYKSYKKFQESNMMSSHQDFMFVTIDKLKIYCDIEFNLIDAEYPPELQYQCKYEPLHLNQIGIFKFNITSQHIKSLLDYRMNNKISLDYDYGQSQSIEYSFLSSVFIDKFYPVEKISEESEQDKVRTCRYKQII